MHFWILTLIITFFYSKHLFKYVLLVFHNIRQNGNRQFGIWQNGLVKLGNGKMGFGNLGRLSVFTEWWRFVLCFPLNFNIKKNVKFWKNDKWYLYWHCLYLTWGKMGLTDEKLMSVYLTLKMCQKWGGLM